MVTVCDGVGRCKITLRVLLYQVQLSIVCKASVYSSYTVPVIIYLHLYSWLKGLICSWDCLRHYLKKKKNNKKKLTFQTFFHDFWTHKPNLCLFLSISLSVLLSSEQNQLFLTQPHAVVCIFSLFCIWCHAWRKYVMILALAVFFLLLFQVFLCNIDDDL